MVTPKNKQLHKHPRLRVPYTQYITHMLHIKQELVSVDMWWKSKYKTVQAVTGIKYSAMASDCFDADIQKAFCVKVFL